MINISEAELIDYALGELDDEARSRIARELDASAELRLRLADLQETLSLISVSVKETTELRLEEADLRETLSLISASVKEAPQPSQKRGPRAAEWILLVVVVIGVALIFHQRAGRMLSSYLSNLEGGMNSFTPESSPGRK